MVLPGFVASSRWPVSISGGKEDCPELGFRACMSDSAPEWCGLLAFEAVGRLTIVRQRGTSGPESA
jgi:hypothetical protein